ncbi:TIGR02444 family protein [Amphritea sp. 1_MG-2023]|uniref:TIGR02444 family protein n=1 Tax=Amphritea sp. 1_MG-2023 TaxID=3062670 RepID=UPI0026E214F6|nr:TIGR02444 family protein [Amphritea sp. 1_MG-2023]MDO6565055.1 TIGR02444 family protein [Amphritea sp. 1_MG-2023]
MKDNNVFWHAAVQIYSTPGVADVCLTLQNRYHLSVNYLLFALWLARQGKCLPSELEHDSVCLWRNSLLEPLRQLRYALRQTKQTSAQNECYDALKTAELAAENVEIELLYDLREQCPDSGLLAGPDEVNRLGYLNLCIAAKLEEPSDSDLALLLKKLNDKAASIVVIG